jgi:hypothetical protein
MALIKVVQRTQVLELDDDDVQEIDEDLGVWNTFISTYINSGIIKRSFSTPNHHYLLHIAETIQHLGPLRFLSTRCMERTIGEYKKEIKSTKDTGINASNVLYTRSAINFMQQHHLLERRKNTISNLNNDDDSDDELDDDDSDDELDDDDSDDSLDDDDNDDDSDDELDDEDQTIKLCGKIHKVNTELQNTPQLQTLLIALNNNQSSNLTYSDKVEVSGTVYKSNKGSKKSQLVFYIPK